MGRRCRWGAKERSSVGVEEVIQEEVAIVQIRQLSAAAERGVTSRAGLTILGEARGVLQVQSSSALAVARHDSWRASDAVRAAGAHVRGERFASVYVHDNLKCRQCSCVLHGYPGYRYHAARIEMFVREPHQESYRRIRKFAAVFHVRHVSC